jgi:hypothetical protein
MAEALYIVEGDFTNEGKRCQAGTSLHFKAGSTPLVHAPHQLKHGRVGKARSAVAGTDVIAIPNVGHALDQRRGWRRERNATPPKDGAGGRGGSQTLLKGL